MSIELLTQFDYTFIIDCSATMTAEHKKGKNKYQFIGETLFAFAEKFAEYDDDGFDVYFYNDDFECHEGITDLRKFNTLYTGRKLFGECDLGKVLTKYFDRVNEKLSGSNYKQNVCVVFTSGEPSDPDSIIDLIVQQTEKINDRQDLILIFIGVSNDISSAKFLLYLDFQLDEKGAKYDIASYRSLDEMDEVDSITDFIVEAIEAESF